MSDNTSPLFPLQPETKEIPLSQGKVAIVDAADYEWLMQWRWHAGKRGNVWYAARPLSRVENGGKVRQQYMHRQILDAQKGQNIDHVSGDGLDNRRANLRVCNKSQNGCNKGPDADNASGYKGVGWRQARNKWRARIKVNGKEISLGHFVTIEEAARAYDEAARLYHGDFAWLNFPTQTEATNGIQK